MINNVGYVFLAAALAVSVYGLVVPHLGVKRNSWNLVRSAQFATMLNFVLVLGASLVLLRAFITDDFSVRFVWQTSSTDLPLLYKVAAFWGGMEGSLLFWELILSFFSACVAYVYQRSNREIIPYVIATLNLIHVFLLGLLVTYSNPLALQVPAPAEGRGLNPLLQHPAMAAHPPLLYLGYVAFSVPFAFAMASLLRGKLDNEWVTTTRRWTLFAWYALTVGQMLGGQWAYEELGWGGYWAWDPVENAAFMPWLMGTAFLHSIMLQEKRNMMKVWNVVLIIVTFGLSILGTFIVRSGVLNSVHAFAQSDIGPAFLGFLAALMVAAFVLMFRRLSLLESRHTAETLASKETTFLLNNLLFVGICFTVFLGTVFPLAAEALRGTKLSIQAPFFNTIAAPLGVALLALIGVCTMIAWRNSSASYLLRNFRLPVGVGAAVALGAVLLVTRQWGAVTVFGVAAFTATVLLRDFARAVRARARQQQQSLLGALGATIVRNQQRYGGMLIHLGVVLVFVGLAGNYFKSEHTLTLTQGHPQSVGGYQLLYQGMHTLKEGNATVRAARIEVYSGAKLVDTLEPGRRTFPTQPEPLSDVAIHRTLAQDLYLVLASDDGGDSVTLRVNVNPLVMVAWLGFPFFTLGAAIAMFYKPRHLPQPAVESSWSYA